MLAERAAKEYIDRLYAAADTEYRLATAGKCMEQCFFFLVAHWVNRKTAALDGLPIARGMEVAAAGQQQAVAPCGKRGGITAAVKYAGAAG